MTKDEIEIQLYSQIYDLLEQSKHSGATALKIMEMIEVAENKTFKAARIHHLRSPENGECYYQYEYPTFTDYKNRTK